MAATKIADIIVPEVFDPYVTERTADYHKGLAVRRTRKLRW